jgi:hypothetical protein
MLKCFSPLKILAPPLFEETLGALFFMLRLLRNRGLDDIGGEKHFFKNLFSNGFNIVPVDAYSKVETGELWIYWRWTHTPKWRYARQYFLGQASKFFSREC